MPDAVATRARVVVLAGPSGAGKSRLAERLSAKHGWPIVRLDDFYRDVDDPALPRQAALGIPDWDDPRSWCLDDALAALVALVDDGGCRVPRYDIATSRRVGTHDLAAGARDLVLAEGIFAGEVVGPLRAAGALHSAWCVRKNPVLTFVLRLARDLRERRKPPLVLLKRGWALLLDEPRVVARAASQGCTPAGVSTVERHLEHPVGAVR